MHANSDEITYSYEPKLYVMTYGVRVTKILFGHTQYIFKLASNQWPALVIAISL